MLIIFHSITWLLFSLITLIRERSNSLLNPLFLVGISVVVFFSTIPQNNEIGVGVVLIINSLFLIYGFYFRRKNIKFSKNNNNLFVDGPFVQSTFLICCIFLSLLPFVYLNSLGYSLIESLTKFRKDLDSVGYVTSPLKSFIAAFSYAPLWGCILGRIWFHLTNNKKIRFLWVILFVVTFLSRFSTGTRGGLLNLLFAVLLTDLYVDLRLVKDVFRKEVRFYISIFFIVFFSMIFLTFNRNQIFDSFESFKIAFVQSVLFENDTKHIFSEGSITSNNEISFCIDNYLNSPRYFHGIWAQIIQPIPRLLWEDKPESFGRVLAHEAHGSPLEGQGSFAWAAGIPGEAMYNCGYLGVILFPFLFGLLFQKIDTTIRKSDDLVNLTTAIMFLTWTYLLIRGDWMSSFNNAVINSLFAIGLLKLIKVWKKYFL